MRVQPFFRRPLFTLFGLVFYLALSAQHVPSKPLSVAVYHPMVINPAFVGSKDFTNISLTTKIFKNLDSQILNFHQRRTASDGFYSRVGWGSYIFQEQLERSWNTGLALSGAYHLPIDNSSVHNVAAGVTLKGILNVPKGGEEAVEDTVSGTFNPNLDFGLYYYGPTAFAGLSVTSLLGTKTDNGVTTESEAYYPREYHLYGGYKFLISRKNAIVVEPSLLMTLNDSTISEPHKHIIPYLKVYLQNFYIGTYLKSVDIFALFFQYQFPRFYSGVFLEFPRIGFLNNDNIIFEISFGVNLDQGGYKFLQYRHW